VSSSDLHNWRIAAAVALAVIVLAIPMYVVRELQRDDPTASALPAQSSFVGRSACIECHTDAYEQWLGSDHDNAMDMATEATVLGDFDDAEFTHAGITSRFYRKDEGFYVFTEGPGGEMAEFEIQYTFGIEPLQQYLVPFPGGRLQALPVAWDTEREQWFTLNPNTVIAPDDWLHWTRNGQNWNGMCAECHSTNLQKNFDAETGTFDTTWSEIDVSCEACHGPGSRHVAWAEVDPMGRELIDNYGLEVVSSGLDNRQYVDMCAPCHSRRSELPDYDHSQADLLQYHVPSLLDDGLYHPDGQILEEVYVWGSFVQSKMFLNGVKCGDCHDAHSLALHQEGNALCAQCHQPGTYDTTSHHFHQKVVEGEPSDGALCIKCHMPEQPYMVIDYRADHSLRVPRPDLSESLGVPNSCSQSGCHDDQTIEWAVEAYTNWYGEARKPHYGEVLAAARAGKPEAQDGLIALVEDPLNAPIVRATALRALAAYPPERNVPVIRRALFDEEALLRHTAVEAVVAASPGVLVELLAPLLFDPVRAVRMRAATQLAGVSQEFLTAEQTTALDRELESYISAMRSMLDFASSGLNLGNLYDAKGDTATAEKYYRQAIEVDSLFFPAKINLAVVLSRQGEDREAESLLRDVVTAYPEQYDAAYSLSLLLVASGRRDEALAYLDQAAEGLPGRSRIHYNRGLLLAQMGRGEDAEAALNRALSLEPDSIDYLYALIDFYARRDRLEEALELARRMVEAHPGNRMGYDLRDAIADRINSLGSQ
jgi:tetratricopeptide (TPR) repeat protein/Zn ribbon nucleic-acid-binding protein